jgi:hypothetical protein
MTVGKLVAVNQQHFPTLFGKLGRDGGARDAGAHYQCVVFD